VLQLICAPDPEVGTSRATAGSRVLTYDESEDDEAAEDIMDEINVSLPSEEDNVDDLEVDF